MTRHSSHPLLRSRTLQLTLHFAVLLALACPAWAQDSFSPHEAYWSEARVFEVHSIPEQELFLIRAETNEGTVPLALSAGNEPPPNPGEKIQVRYEVLRRVQAWKKIPEESATNGTRRRFLPLPSTHPEPNPGITPGWIDDRAFYQT